MPEPPQHAPLRSPTGERLPGLRTRGVPLVLLLGAALMGLAWWHLEGYQIADSVEYMERAIALVRGHEVVDSQAIRSFGFVVLLVPVFALADAVGLEDYRYAVYLVRLFQMGISLGLVWMAIRLAARFVDARSALAAGLLLVATPAFLQWSVTPIADLTAGLCVALALERLLETGPRRRAALGGFWLGLGFLMAYKALALIGPIVLVVALRERWRNRGYTLAVLAGFAGCVVLQCFGDWLYYGRFGLSVWIWTQENVVNQVSHRVHQLGFEELAQYLYNNFANVGEVRHDYQDQAALDPDMIVRRMDQLWYLREIRQAFVLPALVLVGAGVARLAARPSWAGALLVFTVAFDVFALSNKGDKSFRLWLPFIAAVAVLGAAGWDLLFRARSGAGRPARTRVALGVLVLLGTVGAGARELLSLNTRKFGGFWRAVEVVNRGAAEARAGESGEVRRARLACAYHWGVFLRESADVELVKLPHQVDGWERLTPEERRADLDVIASLDWFIAHLPVLRDHPELMTAVNRDFEVHAVLYDRFSFQGLGPLYVLRRRTGALDAPTFWDLATDVDVGEYRARYDLEEPPYAFRKRRPDGSWQELVLLGFEWRPIAGSGYGWLTYHWAGGPFDGEDYVIVDRVTSADGRNAWQNDHPPAYGVLPTSAWEPGWILREGYLLVPEAEPYAEGGPTRPLGGDFRRGDLMPADLWVKVVAYDESTPPLEVTRLVPYPTGSVRAVEELAEAGAEPTLAGHAINDELMARVGRFFIGVHPRYRWRDELTEAPSEEAPRFGRGL